MPLVTRGVASQVQTFRVMFTENQVVLLDGYPRRTERSINFRFFVVLPHDAVPLDKDALKPLLSRPVLAGMRWLQCGFLYYGI